MMRRWVTAGCASVVAGVCVSGAPTVAMPDSRGSNHHSSSICHTGFDPYQQPAAVDRSCGLIVYPLVKVKHLRDGGRIYVYGDPGRTEEPIPPPSFDPLTASDAELTRYGFPLPIGPHDSQRQKLAKAWRAFGQPEPFLVTNPNVTTEVAGKSYLLPTKK